MKRVLYFIAAALLVLMPSASYAKGHRGTGPVKVIFETDMGNDVDDVMALSALHKYVDEGKVELLAVMINKDSPDAAKFVDMLNTWHGHPDIPIGIIKNGPAPYPDDYCGVVNAMRGADGKPMFGRSLEDCSSLPEAHDLYRKILASQPDGSVNIISVGFFTNLYRLLITGPDAYSDLDGYSLTKKKVSCLYATGGLFADEKKPEFNIRIDIYSARKVFGEWPTKLIVSGGEVGSRIKYPASSILNDFDASEPNPIVKSYESFKEMPYDNCMWDLTVVLYLLEPELFSISDPGLVLVDTDGISLFLNCASGDRRYLKVDASQCALIRDRIIELVTRTPASRASSEK